MKEGAEVKGKKKESWLKIENIKISNVSIETEDNYAGIVIGKFSAVTPSSPNVKNIIIVFDPTEKAANFQIF